MKTNRELFEAFDVVESTWKRWSREFLPPDPAAGKSKGKARKYTQDEAFKVWFGGQLLTEKQMSVVEAKDVVKALGIYMDVKGFSPIQNVLSEMEKSDDYSWELIVIRYLSGVQVQVKVVHKVNLMSMVKSEFQDYKVFRYSEEHSFETVLATYDAKEIDNFCVAHIPLKQWIFLFVGKAGY